VNYGGADAAHNPAYAYPTPALVMHTERPGRLWRNTMPRARPPSPAISPIGEQRTGTAW